MNKVNIFQRKRYVNMKANKGIEACRFQIIGHINERGLAKPIIIVTTPPTKILPIIQKLYEEIIIYGRKEEQYLILFTNLWIRKPCLVNRDLRSPWLLVVGNSSHR